jgi:hypothetical protein
MTEPVNEQPPDDEELADSITLIAAVKGLSRNVRILADKIRRNRVLATIAIVGLILDLLLSGLFIAQHWQSDCVAHLRAQSAQIADDDRANVDRKLAADSVLFAADAQFFADVFASRTAEQAQQAFQTHVRAVQANEAAARRYTAVRAANDEKRAELGTGSADACPLI